MLPATARPAWSVIDLDALAHNVRIIRSMLRPTDRFYAVCKNNAYGCGARETAQTILAAGADAFAVSDPEDAERIRAAGIKAPILLYASTCPDAAHAVAELDLIATVHDFEGLDAFSLLQRPVRVHVEVDCGYGRLGFTPCEYKEAFDRLSRSRNLRVLGLYTHLTDVENAAAVRGQAELFARASHEAHAAGFTDIERMAASSRVMLGYPELNLNAVNPGRMLYGMIEDPWQGKADLMPVIRAIHSRVLQVKTIPASFDFDWPRHRAAPGTLRTAVIAFGFKDGLPRQPAGGTVLIRGRRAPIIGMRATEHTVVDVSDIPDVAAGDEVVIVGGQGAETITGHEAVATYRTPMIELLPRMTLNTLRVYRRNGA
ncbi:MAG TPA: alanine racemase [Casimicrobiaceae bacterium]|nr:alanine racemase [Casimicrobiaceae bacterium]